MWAEAAGWIEPAAASVGARFWLTYSPPKDPCPCTRFLIQAAHFHQAPRAAPGGVDPDPTLQGRPPHGCDLGWSGCEHSSPDPVGQRPAVPGEVLFPIGLGNSHGQRTVWASCAAGLRVRPQLQVPHGCGEGPKKASSGEAKSQAGGREGRAVGKLCTQEGLS